MSTIDSENSSKPEARLTVRRKAAKKNRAEAHVISDGVCA